MIRSFEVIKRSIWDADVTNEEFLKDNMTVSYGENAVKVTQLNTGG